jgi:hypothetical protein
MLSKSRGGDCKKGIKRDYKKLNFRISKDGFYRKTFARNEDFANRFFLQERRVYMTPYIL